MPAWEIGRLNKSHERSTFDCGNPSLNEWLKLRAGQFDRKDLSRTFVATRAGSQEICGYYAIVTHHIVYDVLPTDESKGLPKLDIPVVLLGRLAVDRQSQGLGLGSLLLIDALRRATKVSDQVGIRAIEVHAIDEAAQRFYLKYGFTPLLDDPRHLLMPMHEVRKLNLDA